jgi:hypothetical protein
MPDFRGFVKMAMSIINFGLNFAYINIVNEFFEYKQSQLRVITELFSAVLRAGVGVAV